MVRSTGEEITGLHFDDTASILIITGPLMAQ